MSVFKDLNLESCMYRMTNHVFIITLHVSKHSQNEALDLKMVVCEENRFSFFK